MAKGRVLLVALLLSLTLAGVWAVRRTDDDVIAPLLALWPLIVLVSRMTTTIMRHLLIMRLLRPRLVITRHLSKPTPRRLPKIRMHLLDRAF